MVTMLRELRRLARPTDSVLATRPSTTEDAPTDAAPPARDTVRPAGEQVGRILLVVAIAVVAGWFTAITAQPKFVTTDFEYLWRGARLWSVGIDPYSMQPRAAWLHIWPLFDRLFYPLPALLVVGPFAAWPLATAQILFVGLASALLAWRLSRDALWPLLIFLTPSMWMAAFIGQWSPWLTLAMLVPSAGFLLACKPTLGLACFIYRPTWRAFASGCAIVLVSLALMPTWPREWLTNLAYVQRHPPAIMTPGGWILALALLRWRQREARLLLAFACVPQLLFFADQLPLFLVARNRREAVLYTLSGIVVGCIWASRHFMRYAAVQLTGPYVMLACYLPALWIVLRRPNTSLLDET
jgi:hypothetical protein